MNGTQMQDGTILAGDDAQAFRDAGYDVRKVQVYCSARVADGTQTLPDVPVVRVAADANGDYVRAYKVMREFSSFFITPTVGHYEGTTNVGITCDIRPAMVQGLHDALLRELPGFGCFAILVNE